MSNGQLPDFRDLPESVPESVFTRWIRPRPTRSSAIGAMQVGAYILLASLLHVALVLAAGETVRSSSRFAVTGGLVIALGIVVFLIDSHRSTRRPVYSDLPVGDARNRILARMGAELISAYPTRFASIYALALFGVGLVGGVVLQIWTDLVVWPFVVSTGVTVAVALIAFLVSRRQYRRDLQWALDYDEPTSPEPTSPEPLA